jgi:hypothetical protein
MKAFQASLAIFGLVSAAQPATAETLPKEALWDTSDKDVKAKPVCFIVKPDTANIGLSGLPYKRPIARAEIINKDGTSNIQLAFYYQTTLIEPVIEMSAEWREELEISANNYCVDLSKMIEGSEPKILESTRSARETILMPEFK